jgi:cytoskeletal protein CcmA (bactofilin family)
MKEPTVIGRTSVVTGRITGTSDLEIAGRVEGDVAVSGEVVIDSTGLVGANVSASRIVVRGAVRGDLTAEESLVVESGARIVGDLRAPRIAIAQGGLVRGHVQTGGAAARPRPAATVARATVTETKARLAAPPAPPPRAAKAAPPAPPPPPAPKSDTNHKPAPPGAVLAGARLGPPPPVVPVLKKGTKAVQKKR